MDHVTQVKIGYRGEKQDHEEESGCLPIKKEAGCKKEYIPECTLPVDARIDEQYDKIESPEKEMGEDQWLLRIKSEYVNQDLTQGVLSLFKCLLYSIISAL